MHALGMRFSMVLLAMAVVPARADGSGRLVWVLGGGRAPTTPIAPISVAAPRQASLSQADRELASIMLRAEKAASRAWPDYLLFKQRRINIYDEKIITEAGTKSQTDLHSLLH